MHGHAHTRTHTHTHTVTRPEAHSDLVVQNDDIVRVCAEPTIHGLADTADLLQGWGVEVRPAEFQYLQPKPGVRSGRSPDSQPGQWGQHTPHKLVPGRPTAAGPWFLSCPSAQLGGGVVEAKDNVQD